MRLKSLLLIIFYMLNIQCSLAQSNSFETEFEFCLENIDALNFTYQTPNTTDQSKSSTETIKIDVTKNEFESTSYLSELIFDLLEKGNLVAYSLDSKKKLSAQEIIDFCSTLDTVITFDPNTYAEKGIEIKQLHLEYINCYKVKQSWGIVGDRIVTKVLGVIPIFNHKGKVKDLFWIPFEQKELKKIINNPSINWIKMNTEVIPIPKEMKSNSRFKALVWSAPKDEGKPIYDPEGKINTNQKELINHFQNKLLRAPVDTIITFDPITFAENIELVERKPINYHSIQYLRLHHAWYANQDESYFGCKLVGITPLAIVENEFYEGGKQLQPLYQLKFINLE